MILPVESILPELLTALENEQDVVLEAPPGAGKTTLVPLAILRAPWIQHQKILLLEPRRLAAKAAAHRMATLLGERVGETVGYRMRLEQVVGPNTKIEVVTEGILTRMLQADPSLEGVGCILFDEFHERSLEADVGLSLTLKSRALFSESASVILRVVVMSATLDAAGIGRVLPLAHSISASGRSYPVAIRYGTAASPRDRVVDRMVRTIEQALADNLTGSVLAFLPGQGEINRAAQQLRLPAMVDVFRLYGNLPFADQQRAIAAPLAGRRKVVLATNIAETSLTIEGVDIVVDSGLAREPVFDPSTAMTRLETRRISGASSVQRMGRAGRIRPGTCYRLWSSSQQDQLVPHSAPEILAADLAPMALQLLVWGARDPSELDWIDSPPAGAWDQAMSLLERLEAVAVDDGRLVLTTTGEAMSQLPMHPRLAHMVLEGARVGHTRTGCLIAAFLSERDPFGDVDVDIRHRLDLLTGLIECPSNRRGWMHRVVQLAEQFESRLRRMEEVRDLNLLDTNDVPGFLLACAYPDRVARRRQSGGYQLANGRSAGFAVAGPLAKSRWLAVAEVGGGKGRRGEVIRSAADLSEPLFADRLAHLRKTETVCDWEPGSGRFVAEEREKIGVLLLSTRSVDVDMTRRAMLLTDYVRSRGWQVLPTKRPFRLLQARMMLATGCMTLPDASDDALMDELENWLTPYLSAVTRLDELKRLNLETILAARMTFEQRRELDRLVPERIQVPSGSSVAVDYTQSPPVLAAKLQEMFGCLETPRLLNGSVAVQVHLLSPAGRPLQVTQDLENFWREGYGLVRKEMKGRYPKHPWPDDPMSAIATARTKKFSG